MKILLVCEDDEVASCISSAFDDIGKCSVITYHYLLKALDNAQEIAPDAVIINAVDYPLHWKTFVQYLKCMGISTVTVLYVGRSFSEEDSQKARMLGVSLTFCSTDDFDSLRHIASEVLRLAQEKKTLSSINDDRSAFDNNDSTPYTENTSNALALIFTHPYNDAFIIGKVVSIDGEKVVFAPDFPVLVDCLIAGDILKEVSYKQDGLMHCSKATIESSECDGETLTLMLESA